MRASAARIPTILITGSNGQVGFELRRSMVPLGNVVAVDRTQCNLSDLDGLRDVVRSVEPDIIVNAAAYTAVDKAESDSAMAFRINGDAPGVLAEEAKSMGSLLIHYSTDYVFDGEKAQPYVEADTPAPRSVYGKSKLAGEEAITACGARAVILRTCWVAGAHGNNFVKTMLRLAQERESLQVVADQFGAPTTASLIADVTARVVDRLHSDAASATGIYHLAASGETTWHGYAVEALEYAKSRGMQFKIDPADIRAIPTKEYPLPATRPANSRLDTTLLRSTFGVHLPEWRVGVHYLLDQIIS